MTVNKIGKKNKLAYTVLTVRASCSGGASGCSVVYMHGASCNVGAGAVVKHTIQFIQE